MTSKPNHDDPARARRASLRSPLLCCAILFGLTPAGAALATPGAGVTPRSVAIGVLSEAVRVKFKDGHGAEHDNARRNWRIGPEAFEAVPHDDAAGTDVADLVVVEYTIAPGGYFGWHQHGGPVWVIIKQGTLTLYDSDDATCTGTKYLAGSAFLDPGDHTHNARNEGDVPVVVYGTFMLPDDGALRVDAPNPGVCPF